MKGDGILYYMYTVQHLLGEVVHTYNRIHERWGYCIIQYSNTCEVNIFIFKNMEGENIVHIITPVMYGFVLYLIT